MPNRPNEYKNQDKFKDTHHKQNKRYYNRLAINKENSGHRWTAQEIQMVLAHEEPDRVLSEKLGRSVKAIQTIRGTYKDRGIL